MITCEEVEEDAVYGGPPIFDEEPEIEVLELMIWDKGKASLNHLHNQSINIEEQLLVLLGRVGSRPLKLLVDWKYLEFSERRHGKKIGLPNTRHCTSHNPVNNGEEIYCLSWIPKFHWDCEECSFTTPM